MPARVRATNPRAIADGHRSETTCAPGRTVRRHGDRTRRHRAAVARQRLRKSSHIRSRTHSRIHSHSGWPDGCPSCGSHPDDGRPSGDHDRTIRRFSGRGRAVRPEAVCAVRRSAQVSGPLGPLDAAVRFPEHHTGRSVRQRGDGSAADDPAVDREADHSGQRAARSPFPRPARSGPRERVCEWACASYTARIRTFSPCARRLPLDCRVGTRGGAVQGQTGTVHRKAGNDHHRGHQQRAPRASAPRPRPCLTHHPGLSLTTPPGRTLPAVP